MCSLIECIIDLFDFVVRAGLARKFGSSRLPLYISPLPPPVHMSSPRQQSARLARQPAIDHAAAAAAAASPGSYIEAVLILRRCGRLSLSFSRTNRPCTRTAVYTVATVYDRRAQGRNDDSVAGAHTTTTTTVAKSSRGARVKVLGSVRRRIIDNSEYKIQFTYNVCTLKKKICPVPYASLWAP
ncbi:hypothetical protein QTP88_005932 [Uroleucon formosanum]